MLRADFDNHPLWQTLRDTDGLINQILEEHFAEDLPNIERIWVQEEYVRSFDAIASTRAAFFTSQMLDAVHVVWVQVNSELNARVSSGPGATSFVAQAATQAEGALMQMGPWPRAYGKGGEVKQMRTLFEELLEAQRTSIEALNDEHSALRAEIDSYKTEVEEKRTDVTSKLGTAETSLSTLETEITAQTNVISDAVADAEKQIEALTSVNEANFKAWATARETSFTRDFDPLRDKISQKLADANAEYDELLAAKDSYTKLVGAIAADEVALRFQKEARWGRIAGISLYVSGFLFLAGAALPLVFLLFDPAVEKAGADIEWSRIIIRFAIGILAGSAATVVIRLGARLINSANASKRMELELRAIGPFLANVTDPAKVDDARIDLVSKAFGKTYEAAASSTDRDAKDSPLPVTTIEQVANLVQAVSKATDNR